MIFFQTTEVVSYVDYTTIKTVNENVAIDSRSPVYVPAITTFQVILTWKKHVDRQNKTHFNKRQINCTIC